ncbi:hypothetical protein SSCG_06438 [Streptomyces clavuligerus]|nr:hypothetical protein SSCG_06438 [Streptomyces clavuligerus]
MLEEAEPGGRERGVSLATGYALEAACHSVDAARFEALVERGRAAPDPRERADLLTEALGLWRGAAFSDFAHEVHLQPAIARLEEQRLSTLEEAGRGPASAGWSPGFSLVNWASCLGFHSLPARLWASYMLAFFLFFFLSSTCLSLSDGLQHLFRF